jgi:hypothetical protein
MTAVYELIENKLQRIYVGVTELSLDQEFQRLKSAPPKSFAGWDWSSVMIRSVESFGDSKLAKAFFERYAAKTPPPGWTIVTG